MSIEYDFTRPRRGSPAPDRAVLLAPGAGSDRNAATLTTVSAALAAAGVASLRFDFPYRSAGRSSPDRPPVLLAAVRDAAALLSRRTRLPADRLVAGGRSMGGRVCSLAVGDAADPLPALGLLLLGYPLHPPGRPDQLRTEHFARLRVPVRFVSGTRDAFGTPDELRAAAKGVRGKVTFDWLDTADHGFKPLKSSGQTLDGVLAGVAARAAGWVAGLR